MGLPSDAPTLVSYCILVDGGDPHSLAKRYLPDARVSWNGNALSGSEAVRAHWTAMPRCRTELQSYDCHPVPGPSRRRSTLQLIRQGRRNTAHRRRCCSL